MQTPHFTQEKVNNRTKKPTHLLITSSSFLHLKAILKHQLTWRRTTWQRCLRPIPFLIIMEKKKNSQLSQYLHSNIWRFAVGAHRFFNYPVLHCDQKHPLLLQLGDENFRSFCGGSFFSRCRRWRRLITVNSGR